MAGDLAGKRRGFEFCRNFPPARFTAFCISGRRFDRRFVNYIFYQPKCQKLSFDVQLQKSDDFECLANPGGSGVSLLRLAKLAARTICFQRRLRGHTCRNNRPGNFAAPENLSKYVAFHIFGLLDFIVAVGTGLTLTLLETPLIENVAGFPIVLIPLFGVPVTGALHIILLHRLWNEKNKNLVGVEI